jgi:O-antigen ligase
MRNEFNAPLLCFIGIWTFSFLSTLFSPDDLNAIEIATNYKRLITLTIGYFAVANSIKTRSEFEFVFKVFILTIIIVACYTFRDGILSGEHFNDSKRSSGPFIEKQGWQAADIAGGFLATFSPFVAALLAFEKKLVCRIILGFAILLCVLGLFVTYSRGSLLSFLVSIYLMFIVTYIKSKQNWIIPAIGTIIVILFISQWNVIMPQSIINRLQMTYATSEENETSLDVGSQQRLDAWQYGFDMFKDNWILGAGFEKSKRTFGDVRVDLHNTFIIVAAEMGIIGITVFMVFLWKAGKEALRLANTSYAYFGTGFFASVISLSLVNVFYGNLFRDTVIGTFWVALGLLAAALKLADREEKINSVRSGSNG